MAVTKDKPAPYAPAATVLSLVERYRERGLPAPIDNEVLGRAGIPESLLARTLFALQVLGLIDESGNPTETFEGIREATESDYQQRLRQWLNDAYADVLAFVDPSTDDETKVRDAFRAYKPIGQQPRMVTLFLGLCAAAGLAPERPTKSRQPRATKQQDQIKKASAPTREYERRKNRQRTKFDARTQADLPAPITGLLASLPSEGEGWTKSQRDKFITTFGAVLDFCFPIVEAAPEASDERLDQEELI